MFWSAWVDSLTIARQYSQPHGQILQRMFAIKDEPKVRHLFRPEPNEFPGDVWSVRRAGFQLMELPFGLAYSAIMQAFDEGEADADCANRLIRRAAEGIED